MLQYICGSLKCHKTLCHFCCHRLVQLAPWNVFAAVLVTAELKTVLLSLFFIYDVSCLKQFMLHVKRWDKNLFQSTVNVL